MNNVIKSVNTGLYFVENKGFTARSAAEATLVDSENVEDVQDCAFAMGIETVAEAAQALQRGDISAVMAPQAEIEAALRVQTQFVIEPVQLGELKTDHWLLGMAVKAENIVLAASLEQAVQTLRRNQAIAKVFSQAGVSYHAPGG